MTPEYRQHTDFDQDIHRARAALNKSGEHHPGKEELRLNAVGDVCERVSNDLHAANVSDVVSATTALQPELDNFKATCEVLMKTLDAAAQIHPFVSTAVLAFKTAVTFELTRRQNDKRVLTLHLTMVDMMSLIGLLRHLARNDRGSDGLTITDRLCDRIQAIAKDIEACASTCDGFQRKRLIVRVFKSIAWESKLEEFSMAFEDHKANLYRDLSMHASLGIERANQTLSTVMAAVLADRSKVDMVLLFQELRSPEERELRRFIASKGGPAKFLHDDALMDELIVRSEKTVASPKSGKEIKYDLKKDLSDIIKENMQLSENLFHALQTNIGAQMESAMRREGDRIIGALLVGPGDRIVDPHVWEVWTEMGWKGSVDARHLVLVLREFYARRLAAVMTTERMDSLSLAPAMDTVYSRRRIGTCIPRRRHTGDVSPEDGWTLEYINLLRMQPLLEALDDNASAWVTVSDVNNFTGSRPPNWSLPHWMAYWTVGFQLSHIYYYRRIQAVLQRLSDISEQVLPSNRATVDKFMGSFGSTMLVESISAAIYDPGDSDQGAWDADMFDKFSDHIFAQEMRMKSALQTVEYNLDTPRSVTLLIGPSGIEKHLLPCLYLLIHRCLEVVNSGCYVSLHRDELATLSNSLEALHTACDLRLNTLRAACKIQSLEFKSYLTRFSFGLFYYLANDKELVNSAYYKAEYFGQSRDTFSDVNIDDIDLDVSRVLSKGPQRDEVIVDSYYDSATTVSSISPPTPTRSPLWKVYWRGFYQPEGDYHRCPIGQLDMEIPPCDGIFIGSGVGVFSCYTIFGKREGSQIAFTKTYLHNNGAQLTYEGSLDDGGERMVGRYCFGRPVAADTSFPVISADDSAGEFSLQHRPLYYFSHRPDRAQFNHNKPRALWKFALSVTLHAVRVQARRVPWEFFTERRNQRRKYTKLYVYFDELCGVERHDPTLPQMTKQQAVEFVNLEMSLTPADYLFYRSLAKCLMRRQVIHLECCCDFCDAVGFQTTRFICLDCTTLTAEHGADTVDLDVSCMWNEFTIPNSGGKSHKKTHRLLQLRKAVPHRNIYRLMSSTQNKLRKLDVGLSQPGGNAEYPVYPRCVRCNEILSQPYFYCVECQDCAHICVTCNAKSEQDHLSLISSWSGYESSPHNNGHMWYHHMILYQAVPGPVYAPSVEDRLGYVEENLRNLESSFRERQAELTQRLERLEDMMSQLLDAVLRKS